MVNVYSKTCIRRQQGFSLTEMMVAVALGVTLMGGVVSVLFASKSNFITQQALSVLQENARFTVQHLTREIRMAGFNGCSSRPQFYANSVRDSEAGYWYRDNTGIEGFDDVTGYPLQLGDDVLPGSDAFIVRRADSNGLSVTSHQAADATLHLNKAHDIQPGTIMVAASTDCRQVSIFQVTGPGNGNGTASIVKHNRNNGSTGPVPGNCRKALGGNYSCNAPGEAVTGEYKSGSRMMRLISTAFYLSESSVDDGIPSLYQMELGVNAGAGALTLRARELVQGVEHMQVLYGVDSSGNDGLADSYRTASAVRANSDWHNVVSVRLSLRMRSINPVYSKDVAYDPFQELIGTDGADRFMRQPVSTTVQIRNHE